MTLSQEYARMRPLEGEEEAPTVWGNLHRRSWDPIPFLLRQAGKASAWVEAERKFMVGPGSSRQKKREKKARLEKLDGWPDFSYEQGLINKAWWEVLRGRSRELSIFSLIPWGQEEMPEGTSDYLRMVWEARVRCP